MQVAYFSLYWLYYIRTLQMFLSIFFSQRAIFLSNEKKKQLRQIINLHAARIKSYQKLLFYSQTQN